MILLIIRPKPAKRSRFHFYPEDYPILKNLIPVGTSLKKNYTAALEAAFVDPATNPYLAEIFDEIIRLARGKLGGHVVMGVTSYGFGQNALLALKEFFDKALPVYFDSKNKKKFSNSGSYVNELDPTDEIDRLGENATTV